MTDSLLTPDPTLTVTTDQGDYAPGSTAIITATNVAVTFTATNVAVGGTVDFVVTDTDTSDGIVSGTGQIWTVTDGGEGDLDATVNGTVVTTWPVNQDAANQSFVVSATDKTTGVTATAAFTDTAGHALGVLENPIGTLSETGGQFAGNPTHYKVEAGDTITDTITGATDAFHQLVNGVDTAYVEIKSSEHGNIYLTGTYNNGTITFNWTVPAAGEICLTTEVAYAVGTSAPQNDGDYKLVNNADNDGDLDDGKTGFAIVDANGNIVPDLNGDAPGCGGDTANPSLTIDKYIVCADDESGTPLADDAKLLSGPVKYEIVVTNTGNVGLTNILVTDDNGTPGDSKDDFTTTILSLAAGASATITYDGTWAAGSHTNTAEATAVSGTTNLDETNSASYFGLNPDIQLTKLTNGSQNAGDLLKGQAITWTYTVTNDGNVDLTNIVVVDDNGTPLNPNDDVTVGTIASLAQGQSTTITLTGTAGDHSYTNTATATAATITDDCGGTFPPTDTASSGYTGHAVAQEGLTKGYWATHATLWDVVTSDSSGTDLDPFPQYNWNGSSVLPAITASTVVTSGSASGKGLVSGANNGGGDSGLLMGDLNHDGSVTGDGSSGHLFFDLASAQALANSSVTGDARIILAGQAVAAQLNEYQGYVSYGHDTSPNGLINEAVQWLEGLGPLSSNGHSNVNYTTANDVGGVPTVINDAAGLDYTLSGGAITFNKTPALSSSDASWQGFAQVFVDDGTNGSFSHASGQNKVYADGEGLKNALAAYNHGVLLNSTAGFVVSTDGSTIGWETTSGGTPIDVHHNDLNAFWGILADQGITGVHWGA
jgi:hypothetical protein